MNKSLNLKLIAGLIVLVFFACTKMEDALNAEVKDYSPDLAFTLIDSRIEAKTILETLNKEARITTDADGLLALTYSEKVFSVNPDSLLELPNLSYELTDTVFNLDLVSFFISDMILKSGRLTYDLEWNSNVDLYVDVELTNSFHRITGEPLKFTINLFSVTAPILLTGSFDLSDYQITPGAGNFEVRHTARSVWPGDTVTLDKFVFGLEDMKFYYLEGVLSTIDYEVPADTVVFDVLAGLSSGFIWYEDPTMDIRVKNSFGYDVEAGFNVFEIAGKNGETVPIETDLFVDNKITMDYPTLSEVGVIKEETFSLDKTNSNIQEILYPLMEEIRFDVSGVLNPNVVVGHMTDSSILSIDIDFNLPWAGWGHDIVSYSAFDVNMQEFSGELDYANFKIVTENLLPANVDLQLFFVKSDGEVTDQGYTGTIIDSLMTEDNRIMAAASVNADGRATETVKNDLLVKISPERFKKIARNCTRIVMRTNVETLNQPNERVKMYDDYFFDLRLGVEVGIDDL